MTTLNLTVLGSAGSFPQSWSPGSGYLLQSQRASVVLDLGNGAFGNLLKAADPQILDAVFITHEHSDHCADLSALYVFLKYGPHRRQSRLPVYGPSTLRERVTAMYSRSAKADLTDVIEFIPLGNRSLSIGDMAITPALVNHAGESYAFRCDTERASICYSGDSTECESLVKLARGAHTALFESSCVESKTAADSPVLALHMSAAGAARSAQRAAIERLLLTHLVDWDATVNEEPNFTEHLEEARRHFRGQVELALPGNRFAIADA